MPPAARGLAHGAGAAGGGGGAEKAAAARIAAAMRGSDFQGAARVDRRRRGAALAHEPRDVRHGPVDVRRRARERDAPLRRRRARLVRLSEAGVDAAVQSPHSVQVRAALADDETDVLARDGELPHYLPGPRRAAAGATPGRRAAPARKPPAGAS